jgi:hypothetical protein
MGWKIKLEDGTVLEVGKLPDSFFDAQAKAEGVDYWDIYNQNPAVNIARFNTILKACCEQQGIAPPTFEDMDAWVQFTNDNTLPPGVAIPDEPVVDGFPPVPGETEATSSSTSPGDTDGLQPSPEPSPSKI